MDKKTVSSLFDITGKVALVTGATGALGGAICEGYGLAGAKVLATGRKEEGLKALCAKLGAKGIDISYSVGDPAKEADAIKVVKDTVAKYGEINILVTAAGFNAPKAIVDHTLADWRQIIDANVQGTWLFAKYAGEQMIKQKKGGKVILVSSARSKIGMKNYTGYCTSKAGVDLMAQSLACEWGEHHINVNTFNPTVFRSELTEWMFAGDEKASTATTRFLNRIPIGRLGLPEDFVGTAIFLASSASDFMTGANVPVDGGYWAN
jgi:NAD(P)-dependent dehydrogenase (short-subunit alcohol dehydrogenase family)